LANGASRLRFLRAIDALEKGHTVQQIAFDLGYSTPSAFIIMFRRMGGVNPNQYRLNQLRKHAPPTTNRMAFAIWACISIPFEQLPRTILPLAIRVRMNYALEEKR
jgi:hypothetical protein